MSYSDEFTYRFKGQDLRSREKPSTKVQNSVLVLTYVLYLVLGALIFQALEKDFEVKLRRLVVDTKIYFLDNCSGMTQEDVKVFVQMMTSFILSGISPTGNQTTGFSWTFRNAFLTSMIIVSTIGYGTVFPRTAGGQMFCVVFAAIGIPLTIIVFKQFGTLVFLPFEKLGNYLESKGVSKEYKEGTPFRKPKGASGKLRFPLIIDVIKSLLWIRALDNKNAYFWKIVLFIIIGSLLFLVLPPFVFMSLENWTFIEGLYYSFTTISAIGLGDYTVASNPMKETKSITYSIVLLIWIIHGLVWIALLFNLIIKLLHEMELKLSKETSEIEVGKKERKTEDTC